MSLNNIEKTENLNKENQFLLNRLLEISTNSHKTASFNKFNKSEFSIGSLNRNMSVHKRDFRPRSLNLNNRINEDQKIREENIKIAQRLFSK